MYTQESEPTFTTFESYDDSVCIGFKNQTVSFGKTFQLGLYVSEFSKLHLCETFYNVY